ncbi:hypothetical protein AC1031_020503 [Aphanomyces cochlioides]|nr:hypothetical protein AC1031_020503 [Aphanomyces cochlioides]
MMTSHAAASADDLIALSKVCFWAGDENAANAILFLQSLVECVGRGSEVAMIKHEDIRLTTIQETQEWNMLKISCGVRKPCTVYYVTHYEEFGDRSAFERLNTNLGGRVTRNLHTIFDYLKGTTSNDKKVGRVLSGWTITNCRGEIAGGESVRNSSACYRRLKSKVDKLLATLTSGASIDERGKHQTSAVTNIPNVTNLPRNLQGLRVIQLFQDWHIHNYPGQYQSASEKNVKVFSNMKRAMEYFDLFLKEIAPTRPTNAELNRDYLTCLQTIANEAMCRILADGWVVDAHITVTSFVQVFSKLPAEELKRLPLGPNVEQGRQFLQQEYKRKASMNKKRKATTA